MPMDGSYEPSSSSMARDQVALIESSDGADGTLLKGRPVVVLTMRGNKSGSIRKTPLMRVEHDGRYALVASLGGAPRHPVWYYNLKADPHVQVQDGAARGDYVTHEASGAERDEWWERSVEAFPDYADYQRETDRVIPVFVAEPVDRATR
ncbi:nitroreductase family deazaflavin-dependent oxidoreductase [Streptomyces montanisoli]|uniref:Nitroreductase family deazaflavin-dependent oxidoreductase n=1 Tax=Streptomyces montanisoli TaxID=2798581 RepID=A0A940MHY9_9ACTN|nr:nitroreductase family deazaflavin-dependent oxidoreductase [Streptomyces montanisoli]MBP0458913.1 nitroreductase family deazaflavin-dependent oxidoreductase [Streptomyces montanisoli]